MGIAPIAVSAVGKILKGGAPKSLSGWVSFAKKMAIDMEGSVHVSDIILDNLGPGGELFKFCLTPEKINVKTAASFRSYSISELGDIKLPKGTHIKEISWSGILPHAQVLLYPFGDRKAWEKPEEIVKILERWRDDGSKFELFVSQTPINLDVYLKDFDMEFSGGMGDITYSICFIAARDLQLMTVEEADKLREKRAQEREEALKNRQRKKPKAPQIIDTIDKVWAGVKLLTGKGGLGDVATLLEGSGVTIGGLDAGEVMGVFK